MRNCLTSRTRPAPTAILMAISRCLAAPRAIRRLATLAQAINSTSKTMPASTSNGCFALLWRICRPRDPGSSRSFLSRNRCCESADRFPSSGSSSSIIWR